MKFQPRNWKKKLLNLWNWNSGGNWGPSENISQQRRVQYRGNNNLG